MHHYWGCTSIYRPLSYTFRSGSTTTLIQYFVLILTKVFESVFHFCRQPYSQRPNYIIFSFTGLKCLCRFEIKTFQRYYLYVFNTLYLIPLELPVLSTPPPSPLFYISPQFSPIYYLGYSYSLTKLRD